MRSDRDGPERRVDTIAITFKHKPADGHLMTAAGPDHDTLTVPAGWNRDDDGNRIIRELKVKDFMTAIGIVNEIAMLAESIGHHPDIRIHGWNKLRLESTSHDVDALTERDIKLAERINQLLADKGLPTRPA